MAAQWAMMFEADEPVSLRLRPTVSKTHPIHKRDPAPTERLAQESNEILRRASGENAWIPEKIGDLKKAITAAPEATIFRVGARLAYIGHADGYLYQRLGSLVRLLDSDPQPIEGDADRAGIDRYFSGNKNTFTAKYAPELAYTCYFSTSIDKTRWKPHAAKSSNIQLRGVSSLPEAVLAKIFQVGENHPNVADRWLSRDCGILIVNDIFAKDAALAIDSAFDRLQRLADKSSIRRGMMISAYSDLLSHVVVTSPDLSNPIMFDWRRSRRSMDGLIESLNRDIAEQAIDTDEELGRLIGIHAKCKHLFDVGSDQEIFQELTGSLDLLFGRYLRASPFRDSRRLPRGVLRSDFIVDLASRWLAMNAPHDVYISTLWKGNKSTRQIARQLAKSPGGSLASRFASDAIMLQSAADDRESLVFERTLLKLRRIDSALDNEVTWKRSYLRNHTRFMLDMLAVRSMRNELIHERNNLAGGYYITLLLELLKSVIEFRIKCSEAYSLLNSNQQKRIDIKTGLPPSSENAFVAMMHLFGRDSSWSLGIAERPLLLSKSRIAKMHVSTWGNPIAKVLAGALEDDRILNGIRTDNAMPRCHLPDLSTLEIL